MVGETVLKALNPPPKHLPSTCPFQCPDLTATSTYFQDFLVEVVSDTTELLPSRLVLTRED